MKTSFQTSKLPNGLTIATDTVPDAKYFSAKWVLRVGSEYDPIHTPGIAHFFEHLLTHGNENFPDFRWEMFGNWAGESNLYTGPRETAAYVTALPSRFEEWTKLLGAAISAPLLDAESISTQRSIIDKEFDEMSGNLDGMQFKRILRTIYPDHPFSRPVIGTKESINGLINADNIRDFYINYYRGGNMAYLVSGPFTHDTVLEAAAQAFASVRPGKTAAFDTPQIALNRSENQFSNRASQRVSITFPGSAFGRGSAVLAKFSSLFGQALNNHLRDEGLTYNASSYPVCFNDTGYMQTEIETSPELVPHVLAGIGALLGRPDSFINQEKVTLMHEKAEFNAAKEESLPHERVENMAFAYSANGEIISPSESNDIHRPATLEELTEVYNHIISSDIAVFGWGPAENWPSIEECRTLLKLQRNNEDKQPVFSAKKAFSPT